MLKELPYKIKATQKTLWTDKLLKIQEDTMKLDKDWRSIFSTYVMKEIFLCKRERPNIDRAISFLSSIVNDANKGDWRKLLWVVSILK